MDGKQVSKLTAAQQLAQALMLEQVNFIQKQLLQTDNPQYVQQFIQSSYQHAHQIKLNDVIEYEQLKDVVEKYAFRLNLGPELLEFIGFAAQKVYSVLYEYTAPIHSLISDHVFQNWLDKILELEQTRTILEENILHSPKAQIISLQLANQILESNTPWLSKLRKFKNSQNRLSSKVIHLIQDQQQLIELKLEQQLAYMILKQLGLIITLPAEELSEIAIEVWDEIKLKPLNEVVLQIQAIDLEDFFILVYETWREIRETHEIQHVILSVVKAFYEYFADYSLKELLDAVGIFENDLLEESQRFLPKVLQVLAQQGILTQIIQQVVQPFYTQSQILELIEQHMKN